MFIVSKKNFDIILERLYSSYERLNFEFLKNPELSDNGNSECMLVYHPNEDAAYGLAEILEIGEDICISGINDDEDIGDISRFLISHLKEKDKIRQQEYLLN